MNRYAIYFAPPATSPLWRFGSSVLGYDAASGLDMAFPDHPLFEEAATHALVAAPRLYGFHATLKAPFYLRVGAQVEGLVAELEGFAASRQSFTIDLVLASLEGFLALVPSQPVARLQSLADDCVRHFDAWRAPLTAADRQRRQPDRLTLRERERLDHWGYPYVFEDFRFHMTLTGRLDEADRLRLAPALRDLYQAVPKPVAIDGVALFHQDQPGRPFRIQQRFGFGG